MKTKQQLADKPILTTIIAGGASLLISLIWLWGEVFHPFIILAPYTIGLSCIFIATIWILSKGMSAKDWLLRHPAYFFISGFIFTLCLLIFFDWCYFEEWSDFKDVLVEFHGLLFDFLFLGVLLAIYESYREKKGRVERWKEELYDYKGWKEEEAAYRVAGILRRLEHEEIYLNAEDMSNLHLGKSTPEVIMKSLGELKVRTASLEGAFLPQVDLTGLDLSMTNFSSAFILEADLSRADLSRADLSSAILEGANLKGANLNEADLSSAYLSRADLSFATFIEANLSRADLSRADCAGADLFGANFKGANLEGANLFRVRLFGANLEGANLKGANLNEADLSSTMLISVNLIGVNLKDAIVIDLNWFDNLKLWNVLGVDSIINKYNVCIIPVGNGGKEKKYIIKERLEQKK